MYQKLSSAAYLATGLIAAVPAAAEQSLTEAITAGEAHLDFRLRYEDVDQSNPADRNADAFTLRSRLNYKTSDFNGLRGFIELDNVSAADKHSYNSTTNGEAGKSVIADPTGTEVNQAWIEYRNWNTGFKYGRQRINLDNQRFVGGVGFRQNEQTYDAFSINNTSLKNTQLFYARVYNVNRIFGEDSPGGNNSVEIDLLNAKYSGWSLGTVSAYAYLIENDDVARFSTDTVGLRFAGAWSADKDSMKISYALEYAQQEDADNNTVSYDADYLLAEAGVALSGVNVKLGYELLGSDDGRAAFITPLATLHKFQGWADQFLATPNQGIADLYLSVSGKIAGVKVMAVYHDFTTDVDNALGDDDLGDEYGLSFAKTFNNYGLSLKYASYSSGDVSYGRSSADKLWLTATAKY